MKPLAIDLYAGLGGWTEGLMATGWDVVGFDCERHQYGRERYPSQLVLQDVLTIHGRQFKDASLIVCSPPCQEFSYFAMPWSRGKQIAAALRADISPEGFPVPFPEEYEGSRNRHQLTALFDACFRIQREACQAAGRYIPMVVENVKGAQPWVGRANANYGSFFLWGDIATVNGNIIGLGRIGFDVPILKAPGRSNKGAGVDGVKVPGQKHMEEYAFTRGPVKHGGDCFSDPTWPGKQGGSTKGFVTGLGKGHDWRQDPTARFNSKSNARKAASAAIAKIPRPLSEYVGRFYLPEGLTPKTGIG